jgi:hypothetical protein
VGLTDAAGPAGPGSEAVLYVLACPLPQRDGAPVYLMHRVGDVGSVLAYTDLERLVNCCGEHQPWAAIKVDALLADLRDQRLAGPAVNVPLSPDVRWRADGPPRDLAKLAAMARAGTSGGAS